MLPKFNAQISRETLLDLGFSKLIQEFDDHESSREGLGYRTLEPKVISKHFEDIGLDPEIANHNEISGLSGGQKVKVVLAGAMWNNPHILVLDERESRSHLRPQWQTYTNSISDQFLG
jgi:elongation factor 3